MKKNDNKEIINQIIVKGYKAFDIDFSNPFTKEKLYPNNIYKLEGELGYKKNGYNFCTNLEDCLRYINGLEKEIHICPIIALGDIFWYNDEIYEYYNLGCTNKIYIGNTMTREEIIKYADNLYEDYFIRFIQGYKLTKDELDYFTNKYKEKSNIIRNIEYYQLGKKDAFKTKKLIIS